MFVRTRSTCFVAAFLVAFLAQNPGNAAESFTLSIKDHRFNPEELQVPAGQKFKLIVKNEDSTPEEFESKSLKREKIVKGNSQIILNLGPLDPGKYEFFGEFHEESAKGRLIAK